MVALVFAAGLGTRLKPWTLSHPKALVPVGGVPMLERVLRRIEELGPRRIVVNVHHFAAQIIDFLRHRQSHAEILVSDETDALLETGGGLLKAAPLLDAHSGEPILIHNSDILSNADLAAMETAHKREDAAATLLVQDRATTRYFIIDGDRVAGWANVATGVTRGTDKIPEGARLRAFDGIHMVSNAVFAPLAEYSARTGRVAFSITDFYIDACRRLRINAWEQPGLEWFDVGDPCKLARAEGFIDRLNG